MKISNYLKKTFLNLASKNIIKISDERYLKIQYKMRLKQKLDLKNPKTFNQKLQWLKINDRNPKYTKMVDKYEVRNYIKDKIGEEYLIPLIGVFDKFDDINFDKLPNQFVMKCTHDSGGVIICRDKEKLNKEEAKNKINKCLKRNYYYVGREWPYKNVKPRIVIEKYMSNESQSELNDYKLMCFNGKVRCSFVCSNRNTNLNVDFYDIDWKKMPFERHYKNSQKIIEKPNKYEEMIKLAEKLSENITFVRVDFYEINNKIYFGKLTFYPGNGTEEFTPEKYDLILGDMIKLPIEKEK